MNISITKRSRRRTLTDGAIVQQVRYVISYKEPTTRTRRQLFFEKLKQAQDKRAELIAACDRGAYSPPARNAVILADVVKSWLEAKRPTVRAGTLQNYEAYSRYVTGPLLPSAARLAVIRSGKGAAPNGSPIPMLGAVKVGELTTKQIRAWHSLVVGEVGNYSANKALMVLKAALSLAAEDGGWRPPAFPTGLQRRKDKPPKAVLKPDQVSVIVNAAKSDDKALYCAFAFLTGVRPSEQLGLLWSDVDFGRGLIHIRRVQMKRTGELVEATKTAAGYRSVPMTPVLHELLLSWRTRCPLAHGTTYRVWPAAEGGALYYNNYRTRYWKPTLARLGLPLVTPHSARHSFISTLQTEGVAVATVARLAGHKSPAVTLGFYSHSMTDGETAVATLDHAFGGACVTDAVTEQIAGTRRGCVG